MIVSQLLPVLQECPESGRIVVASDAVGSSFFDIASLGVTLNGDSLENSQMCPD
jgi:hypothetical protein